MKITCPHLQGHVIDTEVLGLLAADGIPEPDDGDKALCPVCGRCCVWEVVGTNRLRLRFPTAEETQRFLSDPAFVDVALDLAKRIEYRRKRRKYGLPPAG